MTWILEEPIYVLIIGGLTAVFFGFAWQQTGYRMLLHALLATIALTAGCLVLERMVETEREQIERDLATIARDVETNNLDAILSHVYSGAPEILGRARQEFPRYTFNNVRIKNNVEVTFVDDASPRHAIVTFNVVVDVQSAGMHHPRVPQFVRVKLVHENDHWRVADYMHDNPIGPLNLPSLP